MPLVSTKHVSHSFLSIQKCVEILFCCNYTRYATDTVDEKENAGRSGNDRSLTVAAVAQCS